MSSNPPGDRAHNLIPVRWVVSPAARELTDMEAPLLLPTEAKVCSSAQTHHEQLGWGFYANTGSEHWGGAGTVIYRVSISWNNLSPVRLGGGWLYSLADIYQTLTICQYLWVWFQITLELRTWSLNYCIMQPLPYGNQGICKNMCSSSS